MTKRTIKIVPKVTKDIKFILLNAMADISKGIPIKWDRVVASEERVQIYGWISKEDGLHFDFVLVYLNLQHEFLNYVTSSAKYTKKMLINWQGNDHGHADCIPFLEYFKEVVK